MTTNPPQTRPRAAKPERRWLIPAITSLATAVITASTVLGIGLSGKDNGQSPRSHPQAPVHSPSPTTLSAPPAGRIYKVERPCNLLTTQLTAPLVPNAETFADQREISGDNDTAICSWSTDGAESDLTRQHRELQLTIRLRSDFNQVKEEFQTDRSLAQESAGTDNKFGSQRTKTGPYSAVNGLGVDAFFQYHETRDDILDINYGTAHVEAGYQNLEIEVTYEGMDEAAEINRTKGKVKTPLPSPAAQDGAVKATRELIRALNACNTCRS